MVSADAEAAVRELEQRVGPLPRAYREFLVAPERVRAELFVMPDGEERHVAFYDAKAILEALPKSPVRAEDGLLAIAACGEDALVLDVGTGALYLWLLKGSSWEAARDEMRDVAEDFASLVGRTRFAAPETRDQDLETLARSGSEAAIQEFIETTGVDTTTIPGGPTLAERAVTAGRLAVVKACLAAGCETKRLVAFAVRAKQLDMLRFLVEDVGLDAGSAKKYAFMTNDAVRAYLKRV